MKKEIISVILATILASCGSDAPSSSLGLSTASELRPMSDVTFPAGYETWKSNFRQRALAQGISAEIFDRAFQNTGVNTKVIRLDRNQAEFRKTIAEYFDFAIASDRVARGQAAARQYSSLIANIEAQYGVDRSVILGVWGMETRFGERFGDIPIAEALGTLAYDGRRRGFAEEQLMAALKIMNRGDVAPEKMVGSWAGALGHTQFIPTSYIAYGVDGDGDGKRDLWNVADALSSTANYLKRNGWTSGMPWGFEVTVPSGFGGFGESNFRSASSLSAAGVRRADGRALPSSGSFAIIAPSGANGPKFALTKNFRVIKRYNNATSYALAVGHLGDLAMGGAPLRTSFPWDPSRLRLEEVKALQSKLKSMGYSIEKVDGLAGAETEAAIRAYERDNGLPETGAVTREIYERIV